MNEIHLCLFIDGQKYIEADRPMAAAIIPRGVFLSYFCRFFSFSGFIITGNFCIKISRPELSVLFCHITPPINIFHPSPLGGRGGWLDFQKDGVFVLCLEEKQAL